jgi:AraC-like DNA-binding protein
MLKTTFTLLPLFVSLFWLLIFLIDRGRNKYVRLSLISFFAVTSLLYFAHALYFNYEFSTYLFFDSIYTFANLAVYPLYFIYIIYLTREVKFKSKYFWWLVPALLMGVVSAAAYLSMDRQEAVNFVSEVLYRKDADFSYSPAGTVRLFLQRLTPVVFSIQLILILLIGSRMLVQFDEKIRNYYSDTEGKEMVWTRRLFLLFAVFSLMSMIANVLGRTYFLPSYALIVPSVLFSLLLFSVGYISYRQRFTVTDLMKDENAPVFEEELFSECDHEFVYSVAQQAEMTRRLKYLLEEEKVFTRKELRIIDISRDLNTNRSYVSRLINQVYQKSFSDLINHYRLEEARYMLKAPEFSLLSVSEIASRAGFQSESSFYRNFKKETGMSPGDWRKVNGKIKA